MLGDGSTIEVDTLIFDYQKERAAFAALSFLLSDGVVPPLQS